VAKNCLHGSLCAEGGRVHGQLRLGMDRIAHGEQGAQLLMREYVYVAIDDHTGIAYAELLRDEKARSSIAYLRRAREW
jgi:hypothetical protein